jgi:hypothetical protein
MFEGIHERLDKMSETKRAVVLMGVSLISFNVLTPFLFAPLLGVFIVSRRKHIKNTTGHKGA